MQTKESAQAASLVPFELHWIDLVLPQEAQALAYDAATQTLLDSLVLKLLKSADVLTARALRELSLGVAAAQDTLGPRVFWKICAAYFEAIALGLCPMDVDTKRAACQILLAFRKLARGEAEISARLVQDLLMFCTRAEPKQATDAPLLTAVRAAYGLAQAPSLTDAAAPLERLDAAPPTEAENLVEPDESVKVIGSLRVRLATYNVYLNEADEWSRRLLTELSEWALELHRPIARTTVDLVHSLASSSEKIGFLALAELARALESAMQQALRPGPGNAEQAKVFMDAAEDIRRLLHQFAAGFLKQPDPALLAALKVIIDTCPTA